MTATLAPAGTKCSPAGFRCAGNDGQASPAVHTVDGRHLCGFHSPYDVVEANGKTAGENYLEAFDARHGDDTDEEFEMIAGLEFDVIETKRAIDLPAGHQGMMERPARVTAWKAAQDALTAAINSLSDDRLAAYGVYRRRFA